MMGQTSNEGLISRLRRWLGILGRINGVYQEVTLEGLSEEVRKAAPARQPEDHPAEKPPDTTGDEPGQADAAPRNR